VGEFLKRQLAELEQAAGPAARAAARGAR
jgi:hypothetical protein